ncbi:MAG: hypothetical protein PHY48_03905 [Candidatus Cloacimonetes bacterium]|nr:hypothetical protein [Candidatus Cloacimonadota bacterium]
MKNWLGLALLVAYLLYLSGCAVLDLSSMENAVPLKPKQVEASLYIANSLRGDSVADTEIDHPHYPYYQTDDLPARAGIIGGLKVNIGLTPKCELMARYYPGHWDDDMDRDDNTSWDSNAGKLGLKYLYY